MIEKNFKPCKKSIWQGGFPAGVPPWCVPKLNVLTNKGMDKHTLLQKFIRNAH